MAQAASARAIPIPTTAKSLPSSSTQKSDLQNHRQNQRPPARALLDVSLQIIANLLFDHAVVRLLFSRRTIQRPLHYLSGFNDQAFFIHRHAPHYNLGSILE